MRGCTAAALLATAAGMLSACGAADDGPGTTVEHFYSALAAGDGAAACADLAEEARTALEEQEKQPCAEAITGQGLPHPADDPDIDVYASMARATTGADTLFLSRYDDGWRVIAAGCRPTSGDVPHQCTLEVG